LYRAASAVDEGLAELARTSKGRESDPYVRLSRATFDAIKGNRAAALAVATEFERQISSNPAWTTFAGRVYIALGDYDHGLQLFSHAVEADAVPIFYKDQPLWRPIRRDPRFQDLLRRMRIPPD
jgi:hypothetical protein